MLIFIITFFISFLGSIHPGPLNLSVIQITLRTNISWGLFMVLGGIIPEIVYGYLSVEDVMIFEKYPLTFQAIKWAVVPILLEMGFLEITKKKKITILTIIPLKKFLPKEKELFIKAFSYRFSTHNFCLSGLSYW